MKEKVREKIRLSKSWVALSLPTILFILLSVSYVVSSDNAQIQATVFIRPVAHLQCMPDSLTVGSSVEWISCFLVIDNADVHNVDISTVKLGILPVKPGCELNPDLNNVNIIDNHRMFVRFSRSIADASCFGPPVSETTFTLVLNGKVSGFSFAPTDSLLYIKTCQDAHVHQLQANTTTTGGQINTLSGESFDLSKYSPRTYSLNGYFDCRNNRIIGEMKFFTTGTLLEQRKIFNTPLPHVFDKKRPVQVSAIFTTLDNCFADSPTHFECTGKGLLFFDKEQPFSRERIELATLRVEVSGTKAKIQGGDVFNDKIDVSDLIVSKMSVKSSLPKK